LHAAALSIVKDGLMARGELYRKKRAPAALLGLPVTDRLARKSAYGNLCPVAATSYGKCISCRDNKLTALHKDQLYWFSSEMALQAFIADPESFLEAAPTETARRAAMSDRADAKLQVALEGHCAVTLTETGKLVRSRVALLRYSGAVYAVADEEKAVRFLEQPDKFVTKRLPAMVPEPVTAVSRVLEAMKPKEPESADADELQDHLTYLQVSVSEPISRALASSGEMRHLYPGLGEKSTLLHLAKQLRAANPLNTAARQKSSEEELKRFLRNCAMPQDMKASITRRQDARDGMVKWTTLDETRYKELSALFDAHFRPKKGAEHPVKAVLSTK
jgi:YHS domain-containing protein